jgi:hypothetical protein
MNANWRGRLTVGRRWGGRRSFGFRVSGFELWHGHPAHENACHERLARVHGQAARDKAELSQGKSKLLRHGIERNGEGTHLVRRHDDLQ